MKSILKISLRKITLMKFSAFLKVFLEFVLVLKRRGLCPGYWALDEELCLNERINELFGGVLFSTYILALK